MKRNKFRTLTKCITNDIIRSIKSNTKTKFTKTLPGRMRAYDWNAFINKKLDIPDDECIFIVKLRVARAECDEPILSASVGECSSGDVCMWIDIKFHDKKQLVLVRNILRGVVRHEIEHLTMSGMLSMGIYPNKHSCYRKSLHDINRRKKLFCNTSCSYDEWLNQETARSKLGRDGDIFSYLTCYEELSPLVVGFHEQAAKERKTFDIIASDYVYSFVKSNNLTETQAKIAIGWLKIWEKDKYRQSHT